MKEAAVQPLPPSPLSAEKSALMARLLDGLEPHALHWVSGYMAGAAAQLRGLHAIAPLSAAPVAPLRQAAQRATVLYGSQTGNAKRVAEQLAAELTATGLEVKLVRADAYRTSELKKERLLYVVISTHSVGDEIEPPDDSRGFMEFLLGRRAPELSSLRFSVLALGDTSYPDFCGIGRQVDERLQALGAARMQERGDADVDVDSVAQPWLRQAVELASKELQETAAPQPVAGSGVVTPLHPLTQGWTRQRPFLAEVLVNQRIVANGSGKDIRHIELSLANSGLSYRPGDALGIWPRQDAGLVATIIEQLGLDADAEVEHDGESLSLSRWLGERRELTTLTRPFVAVHAERGGHAELEALLLPEARGQLAELFESHQVLDLLRRWPTAWDAAALVGALRPLAPRMYSIASSQEVVGEEVHLTVAYVNYEHAGEDRWGVATHHLCALEEGDTVGVFIDPNDRFRLPEDPSRDVIMIGPGTGVAPFRAFVQERQETGAEGRQWLFFGNPHRRTDFLYQLEWQQALRDGVLDRLSVAFSRDQEHKIYVQDRLREQGQELWAWLSGGAYLYLCGDANRMAPDVHAALIDVVAEHGDMSREAADVWLKQLMNEGRYARDVY